MSSSASQGKGLITTPALSVLYKLANERDALEVHTKHLWEEFCHGAHSPLHLPSGFTAYSEAHLSKATKHECDLTVNYVNAAGTGMSVALLLECKREKVQRGFVGLQDVEWQVQDYARKHLAATNAPFVWLMAVAGGQARIFRYRRGAKAYDFLWEPEFGNDAAGYLDVGHEEQGAKLKSYWERMWRELPTPALSIASVTTQPLITRGLFSQPRGPSAVAMSSATRTTAAGPSAVSMSSVTRTIAAGPSAPSSTAQAKATPPQKVMLFNHPSDTSRYLSVGPECASTFKSAWKRQGSQWVNTSFNRFCVGEPHDLKATSAKEVKGDFRILNGKYKDHVLSRHDCTSVRLSDDHRLWLHVNFHLIIDIGSR